MDAVTLTLVLVIVLALFFDFTNGFHDTANAMATPIATGALKPKTAVLIASILNLVGAFLSTEVAQDDLGRDHPRRPDLVGSVPGDHLRGAHRRDHLEHAHVAARACRRRSSHALFGGLIGATLVGVGYMAIDFSVVLSKVILPAIIAPFTAGIIAYHGDQDRVRRSRAATTASPTAATASASGQIFSSSLVALAHGTNDAQKTMGVITLALITGGLAVGIQPRPGTLGHHRLRPDDRARHLHGRLADHPHARQGPHRRQARAGLLGRDVDGGDDPRRRARSASRCRRRRSPRAR